MKIKEIKYEIKANNNDNNNNAEKLVKNSIKKNHLYLQQLYSS